MITEAARTLYYGVIERLLLESKLMLSATGKRRSTYCFRHTYATGRSTPSTWVCRISHRRKLNGHIYIDFSTSMSLHCSARISEIRNAVAAVTSTSVRSINPNWLMIAKPNRDQNDRVEVAGRGLTDETDRIRLLRPRQESNALGMFVNQTDDLADLRPGLVFKGPSRKSRIFFEQCLRACRNYYTANSAN